MIAEEPQREISRSVDASEMPLLRQYLLKANDQGTSPGRFSDLAGHILFAVDRIHLFGSLIAGSSYLVAESTALNDLVKFMFQDSATCSIARP